MAIFELDHVVFLQANGAVREVEPVGLALDDFLLPYAGEEAAAKDLLQARVGAFVYELVPQFARAERVHRRWVERSPPSVVAPVVAPTKKSRADLCRAVPHLHRPRSLLLKWFPTHHAALCPVMPRRSGTCQKLPFLYGVQEVAGSNPVGPTISGSCLVTYEIWSNLKKLGGSPY
jgi:hypothetical protein